MTTSTFNSASRRPFAALLLPVLLVSGCGQADSAPDEVRDRPTPATAIKAPVAAPAPPKAESLDALYTADLARAMAGVKKVPFRTKGDFGGMTCSPGTISGTSAASRALTLTLPRNAAARAHVLAVVTPERGLLEIYSPDDSAAEAEDIIVPSQTISWFKARTHHSFATSADELDGLRPGRDTPEPLFLEAGRYRFALVNGIDGALLRANGANVKVKAACSFNWTP